MSKQTLLITGANGWLGRRLVKVLVHKEYGNGILDSFADDLGEIRCLVMPGEQTADLVNISPKISIVEGDIRKQNDCERFMDGCKDGLLIHIAGIIHPHRVRDFFDINRDGTEKLLQEAVRGGLRRAVIMSSNSPCGCNPFRDHLFDESSPYNPYMNYGKSKMEMELLVKKFQSAGRIETVIIRAPWFYGPDQPARQTLFFTMIKDGKGPIVGDGKNLRSMSYLDNLAQGLLLSAFLPQAAGEIFWIADEKPYSMRQIIDTIEFLMEKEFGIPVAHRRLKLPGVVSDIAEMADSTLQAAGLYNQKIHVLSEMNKTIACSVEKAKRVLGYTPFVSLEEGMRRSIQSVLASGQKI